MTPALRSELEGLRKTIGFALARIEEAARSAKAAHDAKLASGEVLLAARVRLLAATLLAAVPGLDALASAVRLFDLEVLAVHLATRARGELLDVLYAVAPASAGPGEEAGLLVASYARERNCEPPGRLRVWRRVDRAEAVQSFGEGEARWVERVSSELLHRLKRAAEGNNLRRAKEWSDKAARLEAIALLLEHESRSAK